MQHLIFTLYDMSQVETITRQPPLTKGVGDAMGWAALCHVVYIYHYHCIVNLCKFYLDIIMIIAIVFSSRPSLTEKNPHAFNCTSWKFRVKENTCECESGGFWDVSCEVPRPEVPFSHQCTPWRDRPLALLYPDALMWLPKTPRVKGNWQPTKKAGLK